MRKVSKCGELVFTFCKNSSFFRNQESVQIFSKTRMIVAIYGGNMSVQLHHVITKNFSGLQLSNACTVSIYRSEVEFWKSFFI